MRKPGVRTLSARHAGSASARPRRASRRAALGALAALGAVAVLTGPAAAGGRASGRMIAKARCERNAAVGTIEFVSPYGYDASAGIMDVFMARKLGYFRELCLRVAIDSSAYDGQELVSAGTAQATGIGSAADALLSRAAGANLTAVATYGDTDPHAIITAPAIKRLAQLDGGTLGYYTNLTPAAVAMLVRAGADLARIHLISLTDYDPTIVTRGQIDGIVGYASNQATELRAEGLKFNEFLPSQFAIKGTYNVMQLNTTFLREHRSVAADFMRADLRALGYCVAHKLRCVEHMAALARAANESAAFPLAQELRVWRYESRYVTGDRIGGYGVQSVAEWRSEYREVKRYGKLAGLSASEAVPSIRQAMDPALVASLYRGRKLIWPGR